MTETLQKQILPVNQNMKDWLFALCAISSISGFESQGHDAAKALLSPYFDEVQTDAVGNLIFLKKSKKENAPTVLIDAHFDEIGLMVTKVLEGGFVRIAPMGGMDPAILPAADVVLYGNQTLRGVVVSTPPHLRTGNAGTLPEITEMMVDTGYNIPADELREIVPEGSFVGFAPLYTQLAGGEEDAKSFAGKGFDDKACGAAASYALASLSSEQLAANVCLLFSVYEETSRTKGISAAAAQIKPDYAMVIDVNFADTPDTSKQDRTCPFGGGISLSMSAATDRRLTRMTRDLCEKEEISYSPCSAASGTGTNATALNLVGLGVPVVDVGLPLKYMHTYNEVVSLKDLNTLCRLVQAFVCSEDIAAAFGEEHYKEVRV